MEKIEKRKLDSLVEVTVLCPGPQVYGADVLVVPIRDLSAIIMSPGLVGAGLATIVIDAEADMHIMGFDCRDDCRDGEECCEEVFREQHREMRDRW